MLLKNRKLLRRVGLVGLLFWSMTLVANDADAPPPALGELDNANGQLLRLRREIADNLRSTARFGGLEHELRFVRYRVQEGDNFFVIMARVSQDAATLASANDLANPNALLPGTDILIPNARGLFVHSEDPNAIQRRFGREVALLKQKGDLWFLPGQRYNNDELRIFRGDGFQSPLPNGRITSRYGSRLDPFTNRMTFHGGLDIAAALGTPVYASRDGRVVRAETAPGYGQLVVIEHEYGYQTYYGHLSAIKVAVGQTVPAGHIIGLVGRTGRATGPHLHFEVRVNGQRTNPRLVHGITVP